MNTELESKSQRILVIDDNQAIHDDFRKILGREGKGRVKATETEDALFGTSSNQTPKASFEIDSALQGQDGLEKVCQALKDRRPYAMAFVDMRMPPGWDGVETIARIWENDPDLQVAICTAYSDHSWSDIVKRLGETDRLLILKKPFDNIEVRQLASALTQKWNESRMEKLKMDDLKRAVLEKTLEIERAADVLRTQNIALAAAKNAVDAANTAIYTMQNERTTRRCDKMLEGDVHNLIRSALLIQLAALYELPNEIMKILEQCGCKPRGDSTILAHLDKHTASLKDANQISKMKDLRTKIRDLNRDLQSPEDVSTMVSNFEKLTGRNFIKPAWLSTEMKKLD